MSDARSSKKAIYRVEIEASFYVLAHSEADAEEYVEQRWPRANLEIELPAEADLRIDAHRIVAQDNDYIRAKAVNGEYTEDAT